MVSVNKNELSVDGLRYRIVLYNVVCFHDDSQV